MLKAGLSLRRRPSPAASPLFRCRYKPDCCLEFPRGVSQAMVEALAHGARRAALLAPRGGRSLQPRRGRPACRRSALLPGRLPATPWCAAEHC